MFCYQCEQTFRSTGCVDIGICGKDPVTAALQDLLIYASEGISQYAHRAYKLGKTDHELDIFVAEALFTTITNVNFDPARLQELLNKAAFLRDNARDLYLQACKETGSIPEGLEGPAQWIPAPDIEGLAKQAEMISIAKRKAQYGEELVGLQELYLYGIKGAASYADHASILDKEDSELFAAFHDALCYLAESHPDANELFERCLDAGKVNYRAMEILDDANTSTYGHPEPTPVRIEPTKGKAILISGHDLKDIEALLEQTEGTGINIYTHGEMLPAHGYPRLKAYKHLAGNYGGPWMNQAVEFDNFPGAILMTTNCIQKPRETYNDRIFTCGLVAWPGVQHISDRNFKPVIDAALQAPGFTEDGNDKTILVGFGRNAVLGVADQVIDAVKSGALRHFFLVGGCDGAKPGRDYYTRFAQAIPKDCVILTLACGKYRFNKLDFGTLGGLPRLMDIGQCNDAYSAIQIALALAQAFDCGVNDLPLSLILSWYEQKAVAILLTLLYLGVTNIRIGPSLPAFIAPSALGLLVDKFGLKPITTPKEDLKAILG
jgi:hydroxylamine reductase